MPKKLFLILGFNILLFFIFLFTQKFPAYLVIPQIFSVLILGFLCLEFSLILPFLKTKKLDILLLSILFISSFLLTSFKIGEVRPGIYGDELSTAIIGEKILNSKEIPPFVPGYYTSTLGPYLTALSLKIFDHTLFGVRFISIFFACLSAIAFYVLLRQFLGKFISFSSSLIMAFSYTGFIIFRQAYESSMSIFFEIISLLFFYLALKRKNYKYFLALGLSLGIGLYTYLNFRLIAFSIFLLLLFFLKKYEKSKKILVISAFFISIFVSTVSFTAYTLANQTEFLQRASKISIFNQGFSRGRFINEFRGNVVKTVNIFIPPGDPNPRYNPSGVALFDPLASIMIFIGLVYLFKKNKKIFWVSLFLLIPSLFSDWFSVEIFPEFHYYGTGHPNTLRIEGIIPVFFFWLAFGLEYLKNLVSKVAQGFEKMAIPVICGLIIIINLFFYFNQKSNNLTYFIYNYRYGGARILDIADLLNKLSLEKVYVTPNIANDSRTQFFLNKKIQMIPINFKDASLLKPLISDSQTIIIEPVENLDLTKSTEEMISSTPNINYRAIMVSENILSAIIINPK